MQTTYIYLPFMPKLTLVFTNGLVSHLHNDVTFASPSANKQSSHRIAIPPTIAFGYHSLDHAKRTYPFPAQQLPDDPTIHQ
jgi:hypothetical protein